MNVLVTTLNNCYRCWSHSPATLLSDCILSLLALSNFYLNTLQLLSLLTSSLNNVTSNDYSHFLLNYFSPVINMFNLCEFFTPESTGAFSNKSHRHQIFWNLLSFLSDLKSVVALIVSTLLLFSSSPCLFTLLSRLGQGNTSTASLQRDKTPPKSGPVGWSSRIHRQHSAVRLP